MTCVELQESLVENERGSSVEQREASGNTLEGKRKKIETMAMLL